MTFGKNWLRGAAIGLPALWLSASPACNFKSNSQVTSQPNLCRPRSVGLRVAGALSYDGQHDPDCSIDEEGRASLRFTPEGPGGAGGAGGAGAEGCPAEPNPWRACLIARHQDIQAFVARQGVFEATICVDGPLPGSLQLKFEYVPQDQTAGLKQLVLTGLQSWDPTGGCQHVVFRADDVSLPEQCPARANKGLTCDDTEASPDSPLDPSDLGLHDAQLLLVTTSCDENRHPKAEPVVLTLSELRFYPTECLCSQSSECGVGSYCDLDGIPELACCRCSDDCPGICR